MWSPRLTVASVLVLGALVVLPGAVSAQTARRVAQGGAASRAALVAERQRVRAELERANGEIDALKRSGRGMREDYRLRERLADAEALARRLTELDARLGGAPVPATRGPGTEPSVSAADGPAELDAKADILADQAQRLSARGDQLLGRARDLRARQTLRRRVGQMERDPFSPLEGSKRRAMTGSVAVGTTSGGQAATSQAANSTAPGSRTVPSQPGTDMTQGGSSAQTPPGGLATSVGVAPNVNTPGAGLTGPAAQPQTPGNAVPTAPSAPAPTSVGDANALSVQLRDLLDPTTLAEIQHLEATGGAGMSYEALERAGAALKARGERLKQQAAALRASEHAAPRAR
jgi:hypothetical protein